MSKYEIGWKMLQACVMFSSTITNETQYLDNFISVNLVCVSDFHFALFYIYVFHAHLTC